MAVKWLPALFLAGIVRGGALEVVDVWCGLSLGHKDFTADVKSWSEDSQREVF